MTCREFVELVTEYLEGGLSEARRAELHAHIDACGGCTTYLEQMRQTIAGLGNLAAGDDFPRSREQALAAFREWREHQA